MTNLDKMQFFLCYIDKKYTAWKISGVSPFTIICLYFFCERKRASFFDLLSITPYDLIIQASTRLFGQSRRLKVAGNGAVYRAGTVRSGRRPDGAYKTIRLPCRGGERVCRTGKKQRPLSKAAGHIWAWSLKHADQGCAHRR